MARKHADTVAERAVAIGVNPDGRSGSIASQTEISPLDGGYIPDERVVEVFVATFASVIGRFRDRMASVAQADPVTENVFEDILHDLEEASWMFQAQR